MDDLDLALAELRDARERHSAILNSREQLVGGAITSGVRTVVRGVRGIAAGLRRAVSAPSVDPNVLENRHDRITIDQQIDPETMYEMTVKLTVDSHDSGSACVLTIAYLNAAGQPVGWHQAGATFSETWGFYQYLEASQAGTRTGVLIEPPASSTAVRIDLVRWIADSAVKVDELALQPIDDSRPQQIARYQAFLDGPAREIEDVTLLVDSPEGTISADLVQAELETGAAVVVVYARRATAPVAQGNLHVFSNALFDREYQNLASLGRNRRRLVLSEATYQSVLQANYFRFAGWQISLYGNPAISTSALKSRYLRQLAHTPADGRAGLTGARLG